MKNIIWFVHVPKTGGTSINMFCNNESFKNSSYLSYSHDTYSKEREEELSKKGKLYKVVCLRDPILHTRSLYSYLKSDKSHTLNKDTSAMSFSEWIRFRGNDKFYKRMENFYIDFFDPKNKDVNNCVNILSDFKILQTEKLKIQFNDFLKSIGERPSFDIHNMKSKSNQVDISDDDVAYLKKIRAKDYQLLKELGFDESFSSYIY